MRARRHVVFHFIIIIITYYALCFFVLYYYATQNKRRRLNEKLFSCSLTFRSFAIAITHSWCLCRLLCLGRSLIAHSLFLCDFGRLVRACVWQNFTIPPLLWKNIYFMQRLCLFCVFCTCHSMHRIASHPHDSHRLSLSLSLPAGRFILANRTLVSYSLYRFAQTATASPAVVAAQR